MSIAKEFQSQLLQTIVEIAMSPKFDYLTYCKTIEGAKENDSKTVDPMVVMAAREVDSKESRLPPDRLTEELPASYPAPEPSEDIHGWEGENGYWIRRNHLRDF